MSADLIKSIISLIVALIPLIIAVITFLRNRTERTTQPIDSPSLKIFNIIRHPVDRKIWEKIRLKYKVLFFALVFFNGASFLSLIFFYPIKNETLMSDLTIILTYVIVFPTIISLMSNSYKLSFVNEIDARYYLFKYVEIVIEADYHYLFNKCHEALKKMNLKIVEVNEGAGTLEACQVISWKVLWSFGTNHEWSGAIQVRIKVKQIENSESSYVIRVDCVKQAGSSKDLQDFPTNSKIANRFINELISKPKNADD